MGSVFIADLVKTEGTCVVIEAEGGGAYGGYIPGTPEQRLLCRDSEGNLVWENAKDSWNWLCPYVHVKFDTIAEASEFLKSTVLPPTKYPPLIRTPVLDADCNVIHGFIGAV